MSQGGSATGGLVLVGGHESGGGAELRPLLPALPGAVLATPGRPLHHAVHRLLAEGGDAVTVLPMTWGRDPVTVAETAKTLRWLRTGAGAGRLALADPFGTQDHLVALLRKAATETATRHPAATLVVAAHRANPFDDAELHRVGHLVRTFGAATDVEVACVAGPEDLADAVRRARLLGAQAVVVAPAGFARSWPAVDALDDAQFLGPLLPEAAVVEVVRRRVAQARHALGHGDDGIDAGLLADHGHGYAHSHGIDDAGHAHPHPHTPAHPHHHPGPAVLVDSAPG